MARKPALNLGAWCHLDGAEGGSTLLLPAHHLVTHAVVVGMTGSGKTGLVTVLVEEALGAAVPTIIIDVKGDLPNLLSSFPSIDPEHLRPWVEAGGDGEQNFGLAEQRAADRKREVLPISTKKSGPSCWAYYSKRSSLGCVPCPDRNGCVL